MHWSCLVALSACLTCAGGFADQTQATSTNGIPKVFVGSFGNKEAGERFRKDLIAALEKGRHLRLVSDSHDADVVLVGSGDIWVKGYYNLNARVRYVNGDSQPIYGGFLSVELKDAQDDTLWSYLATPKRFGPDDIARNLASQVIKKLNDALLSLPVKPTPKRN